MSDLSPVGRWKRREAVREALGVRTSEEASDVLVALALSEGVYRDGGAGAASVCGAARERFAPDLVPLRALQPSRRGASHHHMLAESPSAIYVCFRGTANLYDLLADADVLQVPPWTAAGASRGALVHRGFLVRARGVPVLPLYAHARRQGKRLVLCGHSLGGGVAALAGVRLLSALSADGTGPPPQVRCITFAQPPVGNAALAREVRDRGWDERFLSFALPDDVVPRLLAAAAPLPAPDPAPQPPAQLARRRLTRLVPLAHAKRPPGRPGADHAGEEAPASWAHRAVRALPTPPDYMLFGQLAEVAPGGIQPVDIWNAPLRSLAGEARTKFASHSSASYRTRLHELCSAALPPGLSLGDNALPSSEAQPVPLGQVSAPIRIGAAVAFAPLGGRRKDQMRVEVRGRGLGGCTQASLAVSGAADVQLSPAQGSSLPPPLELTAPTRRPAGLSLLAPAFLAEGLHPTVRCSSDFDIAEAPLVQRSRRVQLLGDDGVDLNAVARALAGEEGPGASDGAAAGGGVRYECGPPPVDGIGGLGAVLRNMLPPHLGGVEPVDAVLMLHSPGDVGPLDPSARATAPGRAKVPVIAAYLDAGNTPGAPPVVTPALEPALKSVVLVRDAPELLLGADTPAKRLPGEPKRREPLWALHRATASVASVASGIASKLRRREAPLREVSGADGLRDELYRVLRDDEPRALAAHADALLVAQAALPRAATRIRNTLNRLQAAWQPRQAPSAARL